MRDSTAGSIAEEELRKKRFQSKFFAVVSSPESDSARNRSKAQRPQPWRSARGRPRKEQVRRQETRHGLRGGGAARHRSSGISDKRGVVA